MMAFMYPVLVALGLAVVTALLFLLLAGPKRTRDPEPVVIEGPERQPCPLCGSRLGPGERVHSTVFATKTEDKIMEISGCPHCRPPASLKRLCPVCKKELRPQDIVTARVFERTGASGKKTHVHVLGCPRCRS
jgi:uncharacterized protein with PIN domain